MIFHVFDPATNLYVNSVYAELQPDNSISGRLPEVTEHYTLALMNGALISVLKPEYEIIDDIISKKEVILSDEKLAAQQLIKANDNLDEIRKLRGPLLNEADIQINILEDDSLDASLWRLYRKALRNCTEAYKEEDGSAKLVCADMVVSEFEFPVKPE